MNYSKIYSDFIADRRLKESVISGYSEKHHVIPKSLGGENEKENIISLIPQDHYFAHMIMARFMGGKMKQAFYFMSHEGVMSASDVKPTRHTYAWARKHFMENLPDHIADMGNRLAKNKNRIEGHKKWAEEGLMSEIVKARYEDPEYFKMWMNSQKDVWTDDRKEKRGLMTKELWKSPEYIKKMKSRVTSTGAWTSNDLTEAWKDPEYREKMTEERRSRAENPEWIEKMKVVNNEICSRPEVKAKHSVDAKAMWKREGFKENHIKKMHAIARKKYSCWWRHEIHGYSYGYSREMAEKFGGARASWSEVRAGRKKSIMGWLFCKIDNGQLEFDGF